MPKRPNDMQHASTPADELPPAALDFDQSHDEDSRASDSTLRPRAPKVRRTAATGADDDAPGAEVMADQMADEMALGEDGLPMQGDAEPDSALHAVLSTVDLRRLESAGALDEAESADADPVGVDESEALRARIAEHASDPNAFEPAEAEMQRALRKGGRS